MTGWLMENGYSQFPYGETINREFGGRAVLHCHSLNGQQIAVTPGFLRACPSCTHERGTPVICDYQEPNIRFAEFERGLLEIIRANQTENGPCTGCRYLVRMKLPAEFFSKYFTAITLHDFCGCNSSCIYCAGSEYFLPVEYVASQDHELFFKNLFHDGRIRPGLTNVAWGGGEPTLVDTFDRTVAFLSANKIFQTINTSGIRFSEQVEKALQEKTALVRISVDSGKNETYEQVKRNPNCNAVWDSIKRYSATEGDFVVKYILFSLNSDIDEVEAFINRCERAGVRKICISVDARSVYTGGAGTPLTEKEFQAAATMYNSAVAKSIYPYFEEIWLPEHIEYVKEIGKIRELKRMTPKVNVAVRAVRKLKRTIERLIP